MIQRALSVAGIECDAWTRMDHAWSALREQSYDAALVDRGLPDGDGLALVRRWREAGQHLPCLILTARDALHDRVEGLEAGADDYLSKPFPMGELVARVRALLRRPPVQTSLAPCFDDLRLLPERALLLCAHAAVKLPRSEVQILMELMRANGDPVRRKALEAAAWGLQEAVTAGALDVAVHRLRRKLETVSSRVTIRNQRGMGYALESPAVA